MLASLTLNPSPKEGEACPGLRAPGDEGRLSKHQMLPTQQPLVKEKPGFWSPYYRAFTNLICTFFIHILDFITISIDAIITISIRMSYGVGRHHRAEF